jgi:hypothetical protein
MEVCYFAVCVRFVGFVEFDADDLLTPCSSSSRRKARQPMVRLLCVMMMNCEFSETLQDADEAVDVRFVERRVQFVDTQNGLGLT